MILHEEAPVSMYEPNEKAEDIVEFVQEATRRQYELAEQLNAFQRCGNTLGAAAVTGKLKKLLVDIHSTLNTLEDLARAARS